MNGDIAKLISLTTFGNHYLKNGEIPDDFYPGNDVFQFEKTIDFGILRKPCFSTGVTGDLIAENPVKWFHYLKSGGCKYLRIYCFDPNNPRYVQKDEISFFFDGVVRHGSELFKAVYDHEAHYWVEKSALINEWGGKYGKIWVGNSELIIDSNATDAKKRLGYYTMVGTSSNVNDMQIDMDGLMEKISQSMVDLSNFLFKQNMSSWVELLKKNNVWADHFLPDEMDWLQQYMPVQNYSTTAQLLFSVAARVSGFCRALTDIDFTNKEENDLYNQLTEELCANTRIAMIAAINSY